MIAAYVLVGLVALVASGLTLISGFGLGTLLLPAFAFFFPIPAAVALTAVVHLANNLFKLGLVGLKADRKLVLSFGVPAVIAALAGGALLGWMADLPPLATWRSHAVTPMGLAVGALMVVFAIFELLPSFQRLTMPARWLPVGGALSGFIGGVSGHQGALRSACLLRFRDSMTHEGYIATNVIIAVMVDLARLATYALVGSKVKWSEAFSRPGIAITATVCAFAGAWLGARLIPKLTMTHVQRVVAVLLVILGLGVASGLLG
jgi:uncharacterized membrane protein YfcA